MVIHVVCGRCHVLVDVGVVKCLLFVACCCVLLLFVV